MRNGTYRYFDDFEGHRLHLATASGAGTPWVYAKQGSGAPSVKGVTDMNTALRALLANDSEAQAICLYHGDILGFRLASLKSFACRVKTQITTNEILTVGLGSARNNTADSVATNAWFRADGGNSVLCETDDGTTDTDDKDSGADFASGVWKEMVIDFANGLGDVRFFVGENTYGALTRVLPKQTFNMSAGSAAWVQPILQLQKASGTTTPAADIDYIEICGNRY